MIFSKLKSHIRTSLFLSKIFFYRRFKRFHLSFFWTFFFFICVFVATIVSSKQLNLQQFGFEIHYTMWVIPAFVIFRSLTESIDAGQKLIQISFILQRTMNINSYQIFFACFFTSFIILIFDIILITAIYYYFAESFEISKYIIYLLIFSNGIVIGTIFSMLVGSAGMLIFDLRFISKFLRGIILFCTPIFYIMPKSGVIEIINKYNPFTYLISAGRDILIYENLTKNEIVTFYSFAATFLLFVIFIIKFKEWQKIINSTLVKGAVGQTYAWYIVLRTKTKNDNR